MPPTAQEARSTDVSPATIEGIPKEAAPTPKRRHDNVAQVAFGGKKTSPLPVEPVADFVHLEELLDQAEVDPTVPGLACLSPES